MKIAVVDDERPAQKRTDQPDFRCKTGLHCKGSRQWRSALELFNKEDDFDMLFIDINLNDMEGTTLAATVKNFFPRQRLCLLLPIPAMQPRHLKWRSMIIF